MRYLTKSRFKLGTECPTKLFYTRKQQEYADQSLDDTFLEALAEGGFQVGELAKAYHPEGVDVKTLDYEDALTQTNRLLEQKNPTIFEAAVKHENLFIRIDVLDKQDKILNLIEVKAKSFENEEDFIDARSGKIRSNWEPYLIDVAFQEFVLRQAFPHAIVRPYLMLVDKNARTTVKGLNQKFKIIGGKGERVYAKPVGDVSPAALGEPILTAVNVREYVKMLQEKTYEIGGETFDFAGYVKFLAARYEADEKVPPDVGCKKCDDCTFKTTPEDEARGLKSGFRECWRETMQFTEQDFARPSVMDLWNFRRKEECLEAGRFFLQDLDIADFDLGNDTQARQWLQIEKTLDGSPEPWIDVEGLRYEMSRWTWPLHFIDFETSAVAIPFSAGRRPYEVVAFQFSHHIVHEDGRIEHVDEYLNTEPGEFPNFEFARRLKASLENDRGTIFRYAAHENTVLNQIIQQLEDTSEETADGEELVAWLRTITHSGKDNWTGSRDMVDMLDLVKKYYYQIEMGGSNSIKQVLPAVLNTSNYLQEKYSDPIYNSRNFSNMTWVQKDETGKVKDPYKLLPPVFDDIPQDNVKRIETKGRLADGGAAMTAYARLQFSDISKIKRKQVREALLRYCELDTLAMVMIWEAWQHSLRDIRSDAEV
ncbi:MAG: DUF2779 domain-containing protein [Lentisphaeria bacterium]